VAYLSHHEAAEDSYLNSPSNLVHPVHENGVKQFGGKLLETPMPCAHHATIAATSIVKVIGA
jgi:hypothetical protein